MGFRDMFRPKWQHSQAKVRAAAIAQLNDSRILGDVGSDDPDASIRKNAIERLALFAGFAVDLAVRWSSAENRDRVDWVAILRGNPLPEQFSKGLDKIIGKGVLGNKERSAIFQATLDNLIQTSTRTLLGRLDWIARNSHHEDTRKMSAMIVVQLVNRVTQHSALRGGYLLHPDILSLVPDAAVEQKTPTSLRQESARAVVGREDSAVPRAEENNASQFAKQAVDGPAECRIPITEFANQYEMLTTVLREKGLSNHKIVELVNAKLLGVCPECHTWSGGQGLAMLATLSEGKGVMFRGASGGADRFLNGVCRNPKCSCKDVLIFWRPDEDRSTIERLRQMGIAISPQC